MILVDTSIWIDLLGRQPVHRVSPDHQSLVATSPPVIQEVLQGVRDDVAVARVRSGLMALPRLGDPVDVALHLAAADLYGFARRKGLTIRSGVDCLIATIAMHHDVELWHRDRDFDALKRVTRLRAHSRTTPA